MGQWTKQDIIHGADRMCLNAIEGDYDYLGLDRRDIGNQDPSPHTARMLSPVMITGAPLSALGCPQKAFIHLKTINQDVSSKGSTNSWLIITIYNLQAGWWSSFPSTSCSFLLPHKESDDILPQLLNPKLTIWPMDNKSGLWTLVPSKGTGKDIRFITELEKYGTRKLLWNYGTWDLLWNYRIGPRN